MKTFKKKLYLTFFIFLAFCINSVKADSDTAEIQEETDDRPTYTGYILRIDESNVGDEIAELEGYGVRVLYRRGDLLLAYVPDEVESPDAPKSLKGRLRPKYAGKIAKKRGLERNIETMDKALMLTDVDKIHSGTLQSNPFDGSGVVVGFCDIGFDSRHINFLNSSGTECRVRLVVDYDDEHGERNVYSTPQEIYDWETDNDDKFHATHVAGIMTGSYSKSGYCGVAPGADIVATTSRLTDVSLLAGVEDIISYAKSVSKPAVVNLSVGNYLGPHDGTSLFCQYLDRCAEDAIICISAGNEGATNNHIRKALTESDKKLFCVFANNKWDNLTMYGATDFYSDSSESFTVKVNVRHDNYTINNMEYSTPEFDFSNYSEWVLTSNPEYENMDGYLYSPEFAEHFQGEVYLLSEVDPENGRYHVQVFYDCVTEELNEPNPWSKYRLGVELSGKAGMVIDGFADSTYSWFQAIPGYKFYADTDFCVSDLATGHNVVSVGMYYAQEGVEMESGDIYGGGEPYTVYPESGYGTLDDGRILPLTVAPGGPIVSSQSSAYIAKHGSGDSSYKTLAQFITTDDEGEDNDDIVLYSAEDPEYAGMQLYDPDRYYYWMPYAGTSMSTPYVAGVIATWLQANSALSSEKVISIIESTNEKDVHTYSSNPRHGRGYLQSYSGLLEVLKGVNTVVENSVSDTLQAWVSNGEVVVLNPVGCKVIVNMVAIDGKLISEYGYDADEVIRIPLENLPQGLTIARISALNSSGKTVAARTLKIMK